MCFIATSNLLTRQLVNSSTRSYAFYVKNLKYFLF